MEERAPETASDSATYLFGPKDHPRRARVSVEDGVLAICYEKESVEFSPLGPEPDGKMRRIEIRYRGA
jgi:hypothetical protein